MTTILASLVLATSLVLLPLFGVTYPPLTDLPNHLARISVLRAEAGSLLLDYYQVHWAILPNLATDLLLLGASQFMSLAIASKLLVGLIAVGWIVAPFLLHYAVYRQWSVVPLVGAAFFFNRALAMGFMNFTFGTVVLVMALAAWILLESRPLLLRATLGAAMALLLFFCHLTVAGIFLIGLYLWELVPRSGRDRPPVLERLFALAAATLAIGIAILLTPRGDELGADLPAWPTDILSPFIGGAFDLASYLQAGSFWSSLAFLLLAIAVLVALARRPDLRLGLLCLALLLLFLFLPFNLIGGAHADWRMLAPLTLCLAAWLPFRLRRVSGIAWAGVTLGLLAVQVHSVNIFWQRGELLYGQFETVAEVLPPGSRLYYAALRDVPPPGGRNYIGLPNSVLHYGSYATVERGIVVPSLFARISQQPIIIRPGSPTIGEDLRTAKADNVAAIDWDAVAARFDYVLLAAGGNLSAPAGLAPLATEGIFHLYRVTR